MSMEREVKITCPECGTEGDFILWQSVNTQLDPEAKQKVLNGELFQFTCPKCGSVTNVNYDLLYHQMEDLLMIQVASNDNEVKVAAESFDKFVDGSFMPGFDFSEQDYRFRIVRNLNQLREKIYIFDQGLDDRILEILKILMFFNPGVKPDVKQFEEKVVEVFLDINEGAPEKFAVRFDNGKWRTAPFIQQWYDEVKSGVTALDDNQKGYVFDHDWAVSWVEAHCPNGLLRG